MVKLIGPFREMNSSDQMLYADAVSLNTDDGSVSGPFIAEAEVPQTITTKKYYGVDITVSGDELSDGNIIQVTISDEDREETYGQYTAYDLSENEASKLMNMLSDSLDDFDKLRKILNNKKYFEQNL